MGVLVKSGSGTLTQDVRCVAELSRSTRPRVPHQVCVRLRTKARRSPRAWSHQRFHLDRSVNVDRSPPENRLLMTGLHSVSDVFCKGCLSPIGWTYIHAYEPSEVRSCNRKSHGIAVQLSTLDLHARVGQRYKIGMFVLEKAWLARCGAAPLRPALLTAS